jgi:DNA invertase Pin-like site-specific DNA recombinase
VDQVIGYVRVSTIEQGDSGAGLEAQRRTITAYCQSRGWTLLRVEQDVTSGATTNGRRGLADALAAIRRGEAGTLVTAKLDRLSRSVGDFAAMLTDARGEGWNLCVLDLGCDLSTPMGEAMAGMASVFAQFERRVIGERTRAALAVKRSQGVRLGRPRLIDASLRRRIHRLRAEGRTMQAIADLLNAEGVPTAKGGQWLPSTIDRVLKAEAAPAAQPPGPGGVPRAGSLAYRRAALDELIRAEHDRKLRATSRR